MSQRDNLLKRCPCPADRWLKCSHGWHLALRHDGKRYAISLDKYAKRRGLRCPRSHGDAETLADQITREIETGVYRERPTPPTPSPSGQGKTFAELWPVFVDTMLSDWDTIDAERGRYRIVEAALGPVPVDAITETQIEAAYASVTKGLEGHTKEKYRGALKRFFKWAVRKGHCAANPITEDANLKVGTKNMRTRRVHRDEEAKLLTAAAQSRYTHWRTRLVAILVAALDVSARVGELLAMQWRDVLWDEGPHGRVHIRAVAVGARKNRKPRKVPMTPRLVGLLQGLWDANPGPGVSWKPTDYVFGNAVGGKVTSIYRAWAVCVLRAHGVIEAGVGYQALDKATLARLETGDIGLHFHDLRHEGAYRWLEQGKTLPTIARLLGHSNLATLKVYLGIGDRDALDEAERIDGELYGPLPPTSAVVDAGRKKHEDVAATRPRGSKPAAKAPTVVVGRFDRTRQVG